MFEKVTIINSILRQISLVQYCMPRFMVSQPALTLIHLVLRLMKVTATERQIGAYLHIVE